MRNPAKAAVVAVLLASLTACGQHLDQGPLIITTVPPSSSSNEPEPEGCPTNGLSYAAGAVDAALGHRAFVVTLLNCGTSTRQVSGYPEVRVLDGAGQELEVQISHRNSYMAIDPGPRSFPLAPGKTLLSVLRWSATVTSGDTQTGAAVTVAVAGEAPRTLRVKTDLGTTGELAVTAWNTEILQ